MQDAERICRRPGVVSSTKKMALGVLGAALGGAGVAVVVLDTCASQALAGRLSMPAGGFSRRERFCGVAAAGMVVSSLAYCKASVWQSKAAIGCWTICGL